MIWIISGPSCVGKSSFIQHGYVEQFTGLPSSIPTIFPLTLECSQNLPKTFFFHYNILRPYRIVTKKHTWKVFFKSFLNKIHIFPKIFSNYYFSIYKKDLPWQKLLKINIPKRAIILVTGKEELLRRAGSRSLFEDSFFHGEKIEGYPSIEWIEYLMSIDLEKIYLNWFDELVRHNIDYTILDSTNFFYRRLSLEDALLIINKN